MLHEIRLNSCSQWPWPPHPPKLHVLNSFLLNLESRIHTQTTLTNMSWANNSLSSFLWHNKTPFVRIREYESQKRIWKLSWIEKVFRKPFEVYWCAKVSCVISEPFFILSHRWACQLSLLLMLAQTERAAANFRASVRLQTTRQRRHSEDRAMTQIIRSRATFLKSQLAVRVVEWISINSKKTSYVSIMFFGERKRRMVIKFMDFYDKRSGGS